MAILDTHDFACIKSSDKNTKKDKKKLFCKNIMCPCNNAEGDDGTAPLEEYYCLSDFCEYPSAWMAVELTNEPNSK